MSRIDRKKQTSSYAYVRHFAIATVALALGIGVFADGEQKKMAATVAMAATQSSRNLTSSEARHQRNGTKATITVKSGARLKMEQSAAAFASRADAVEATSSNDESSQGDMFLGDGSGVMPGTVAQAAPVPLPANITVASLDGLTPQQRVELVRRSREAAAARMQAAGQNQAQQQPRMRQINVPGQPPVMVPMGNGAP